MKTQMLDAVVSNHGPTEIWSNNPELQLLSGEVCLPDIGSSQVSSILSNLDNLPEEQSEQTAKAPKRKRSAEDPTVKKTQEKRLSKKLQYITCDFCPFLALCEEKIAEHLKLAHKNKKPTQVFELQCPVCPNVFYHKLSLQAHLNYDHCVSDPLDIADVIRIVLHSKKSSVYKSSLPLFIDLDKTPVIIEGAKIIEENVVEEEVTKNETVELNVKEVEEEQRKIVTVEPNTQPNDLKTINKCELKNCKIRMKSPKLLQYHSECHFNNGFICKECGELFSYWRTLAGHLWRNHNLDMELFKCDKCDFRTPSLSRLNTIHRLIHGTTYSYKCEVCGKSFKNGQQLRNHKDLHKISTTDFMCDECDRSFSNKKVLKKHMDSVHKKLKPFLCTYCGYEGSTSASLQMHIRRHTGEKPFKCKQCDYSTADHNSLRRHKLRHTGEKPYKCPHCHYQCIQTSTYKAHIKTKHPGLDKELLFSCSLCQFRSINKQLYNVHLASHN